MNDALVIEVVRKSVTVDCAVEEAFRIYTAEAASWWPTDGHSIYGERVKEIVFEGHEGGEVYEIAETGETAHWATVLEWQPPNRLVLAWEVTPSVVGTQVEVRFLPDGDGTRVEVEHRGWEHLAERAAEKRDQYDTGWGHVLDVYCSQVGEG